MKKLLIGALLTLFSLASCYNKRPVCTVYSPHSILENKENYRFLYAGTKKRYSTCTGVAWFHDTYFVTLNFLGNTLTTYYFDQQTKTATVVQEINNMQGAQLSNSENLAISPDGTLLAVCAADPVPGVTLYALDTTTHMINPKPLYTLKARHLVHNVRFTPDGNYIATTGWDDERSLCMYKVVRNPGYVKLERIQSLVNNVLPLKPKAITFTKDMRFAVVCYGQRVAVWQNAVNKSVLAVYSCNPLTGTLGVLLSILENNTECIYSEDITFVDNDHAFILSNQGADTIRKYTFNLLTGNIGVQNALLENPESELSFPHGISVSENGTFLAVTNYGNDSCNVYEIA